MTSISLVLSILLYLLASALLVKRLAAGIEARVHRHSGSLISGYLAVILHAYTLYGVLVLPHGLNLSFFLALSFTGWLASTIILVSALRQPTENLGIIVFPFTAISLVLQGGFGSEGILLEPATAGLQTHILISMVSYSLLTLAAIQAILLAVQNKQLRNRHPGGFIRALPPLETMESLLFRLIGIGYLLLSLSLISAVPYTQDIFQQHLVHKTILSISAWVVFAILLFGRWRFGWRGKVAIRWTLSGFVVLMLAYFGSKLVRELIIGVS